MNGSAPRLALVCDLREEGWHSMDLVAEMLLERLGREHPEAVDATLLRPSLRRRLTSREEDGVRGDTLRLNADRVLNRFWDYPRLLRRTRGGFDLFHVIDHSYGQLVHHLPAERTVVTCHDLHTFKCLLDARADARSAPFRLMTRRIMNGVSRAARVVFDTRAVRDEAVAHGVVAPEQAVVVPLGVDLACTPHGDPRADGEAERLLRGTGGGPYILHVGATYGRKRIDLVLRIFAEVLREVPGAVLVRVGGEFPEEHARLARDLGVAGAVRVLPFVDRDVLAAVYRRAAVLILPSEEEGFGFPVLEAMTCGTPVVASDLPVLREVGGEAAVYCPVGDVTRWGEVLVRMLSERRSSPDSWERRRAAGFSQAAGFTWGEYARRMVNVYQEVLAQ